jgi:hypothetical protein
MGFSSCNSPSSDNQVLQNRIDSLEKKLGETYKPGFGEFMSGIQIHHAKLWFAGENKNWRLATFEINEIEESLSGIKQYCTDRPETKSLGMIDQPIDSINAAIGKQDPDLFKKNFNLLTQTCNNCHKETNHEFNVITIPLNPPFSNQDFKAP